MIQPSFQEAIGAALLLARSNDTPHDVLQRESAYGVAEQGESPRFETDGWKVVVSVSCNGETTGTCGRRCAVLIVNDYT